MTTLPERIAATMPLLEDRRGQDLLVGIRGRLKKAFDEDRFSVPQHDIMKFVRLVDPVLQSATTAKAVAIAGGIKDFKRRPSSQQLIRPDGAWFHFTLTVGERADRPLELVAYDFELVYPKRHLPHFVRFDLNQPGHPNEAKELRSHLHPGRANLLLPAIILDPYEALELMLGLQCVTK